MAPRSLSIDELSVSDVLECDGLVFESADFVELEIVLWGLKKGPKRDPDPPVTTAFARNRRC